MSLTNRSEITARLQKIGSYEVIGDEYLWKTPETLENDFSPLELALSWEGPVSDDVLMRLLEHTERFLARFREYLPQLQQHIVALFRDVYEQQMSDWELEELSDETGVVTDANILAAVQGGAIILQDIRAKVRLTAQFDVDWDPEHGVEIEFTDSGELIQGWK